MPEVSGPSQNGDSLPVEGLDLGLEAAYAGEESVLARLAPDGVSAVPIHLGEGDERSSPLPVGASRAEGRYRVLGEIARGGVGVVYRGHDVDLGRDVAMKVIRPEHGKNDEVVQRFVEEAQIGGQLQHPGIVPVYEIGLDRDGKPYFTMKLVKGQTLSAMIKDTKDDARGGRAQIRIFEAVCQTMAYAHARGVIHRDLKPSNVMTGAFGEVLVVDWGMGKVLRRGGTADEKRARQPEFDKSIIETFRSDGSGSESMVGSVLGTPRYMPPEQARGDIDAVDERSDVFSLGAVLCELLTGKAPYLGKGHEALFQAAKAELEGAFERLDACSADPVLVALAKASLAPAPSARPQDAGEVASAVTAYLASLDDRAREARLAAVEATAEAEQERKRSRSSLLLGSALVGLVLVGVGLWGWRGAEAARRGDDAAARLAPALDEALRIHGEVGASEEPAEHEPALQALRRAESLAAVPDVPARSRERLGRVREKIEASYERAREARAARERNDEIVAQLQRIAETAMLDSRFGPPQEAYAQLFLELGIDVLHGEDDEVRRALDASPIRSDLERHLDSWASFEMLDRIGAMSSAWPRARQKAMADVGPGAVGRRLQSLETDPWARRLLQTYDKEGLIRIMEEDDLHERPFLHQGRLAVRLVRAGADAQARVLLERLAREHPGNAGIHEYLRLSYSRGAPIDTVKALRHATACVALQPRSARALMDLGGELVELGRGREAVEAFDRARALMPGHWRIRSHYYDGIRGLGRSEEALAGLEELLAEDDSRIFVRGLRGSTLYVLKRFEEAIEDLQAFIAVYPTHTTMLMNMALAQEHGPDPADAEATARRVLELHPAHPAALRLLARRALENGDLAKARRLLERSLVAQAGGRGGVSARISLVAILDHQGEHRAALQLAEEALALAMPRGVLDAASPREVAQCWRSIGIAQQGLHAWDAATQAYGKAVEVDPGFVLGYEAYARALAYVGRLNEARSVLAAVLEENPKNDALLMAAARMHWQAGDLLAAWRAIQAALDVKASWHALQLAAQFCPSLGANQRALDLAERAVALQPQTALSWIVKAQALNKLGRESEALVAAEQILRLDPKQVDGHLQRAAALVSLGRAAEAKASLAHVHTLLATFPANRRAGLAPFLGTLAELVATTGRLAQRDAADDENLTAGDLFSLANIVRHRGDYVRARALYDRALATPGALNQQQRTFAWLRSAQLSLRLDDERMALQRLGVVANQRASMAMGTDSLQALLARCWFEELLLDARYASVREPEDLAKLTPERREAWEHFWTKVREVVDE